MADLRKKIADADKDIASGSINSNRLKQQKEQYRQELQALVDHNNAKEAEAKSALRTRQRTKPKYRQRQMLTHLLKASAASVSSTQQN